jgi:hypothetical protein
VLNPVRRDRTTQPIGAQVRVAERHTELALPEDRLDRLQRCAGRGACPGWLCLLADGVGALVRRAAYEARLPVVAYRSNLIAVRSGSLEDVIGS